MSDVGAPLDAGVDWVEELQNKVFEECLAMLSQQMNSRSTDLSYSDDGSSSSSISELCDRKTAPISVIIACIHRNFAYMPHFRKSQGNEFLEELRRSLQDNVRDCKRVGWRDFRDSSKHWFLDLVNAVRQNNNNNNNNCNNDVCSTKCSDAPTSTEDASERGDTAEYCYSTDAADDEHQPDNLATCYSCNSSSMGLGTMDSMIEYSDDTDQPIDNISVDLQIRMRRYNEETASLKAELLRVEEIVSNLEIDLRTKQVNLEKISTKYTKVQKELEEHKDLLAKSEKREESCRQEVRALQAKCNSLQKKVTEFENEKVNVANLNARIQELSKLNSEYAKQLAEYKIECKEKQMEYEYLQETYNELRNNFSQLEKSHEQIVKEYSDKIEELTNANNELQFKSNKSCDSFSSQLSLTPPSYAASYPNVHSTPYNKKKLSCQDSLYTELKASGFNIEEEKILQLKEELSFYNEEIALISEQIEEALQNLAASRNEICPPSIQLVETNGIQSLKHKITTLLNLMRSCPAAKELPSSVPLMGEASREKPDVLPKKGGYVFSDRDIATDKGENDLIATVPPTILVNGYHPSRAIFPSFPEISGVARLDTTEEKENEEPEIIIPINEALKRITALNDGYPDPDSFTTPKLKSIFTSTNKPNWLSRIAEPKPTRAKGDATYCLKPKQSTDPQSKCTSNNMKTLKTDTTSKDFETSTPSSTGPIPAQLDTRYVTMTRPSVRTYLMDKSALQQQQSPFGQTRSEIPYCRTPCASSPQRKLSVYHRSFDVDSLQTPSDKVTQVQPVHGNGSEKKRSVSTPDAQEAESLLAKQSSSPRAKCHLMNYRVSANFSAELSASSSSNNDDSSIKDAEDGAFVARDEKEVVRPIIAPTKFKVPEVNQTTVSYRELEFTPMVGKGILSKQAVEHSRILGSSAGLAGEGDSKTEDEVPTISLDTSTLESFKLGLEGAEGANNSSAVGDQSHSGDQANVKRVGADDDKTTTSIGAASTPVEPVREDCKNSGAAMSDGVPTAVMSMKVAPAVGRAMSSGEDSSAESECDARKNAVVAAGAVPESSESVKQPEIDTVWEEEAKPDNTRSEDDVDPGPGEDKAKVGCQGASSTMNGEDRENSRYSTETAVNSSSPDVVKGDESPKAFPSWTDEKLQESGIASFPDVDSELSENLNEEQLKKCTIFSIGLSADRMTLSKRLELAVRHRDQAELNFNNEVNKMQLNIMELAPLCVDSESLERVERVRTQLEMVSRCTRWISSSAETLGAVRQERRVSRAVLLADRYLQTLRSKCEKLAGELAETKRILAENNIVIEENLSELGDDVPRVRYRAVPNNNRTMMARRRASIATISRPLLGSNQDISKEVPRQRNSVSGRAPGVRRPSLCFEAPKWENEKLDRTDSSNSTTELQEIFEQAESRRQSREENHNLLRTSVNNLALTTSEHVDEREEEVWSNPHEEFVSYLVNNEIYSNESRQHHRHPLICWLLAQYVTWKPTIWSIMIAFIFGVFVTRVVSSSDRHGPPISWWSLEEILSQYIHVENVGPRPL
ncbi:uncharacterized protein LOC106643419 isoform X2 [Copidosoma floridanum]|uniref:uncharacterized protein LOC106643419 isoform X2 n=1 Tax=Copidosoma floridanum TaxID=29053 RepID=UPI0006C97484|nr:uncharacterized protein LOC106643419 isoform X2 [Copidosoma floridanum]